VTQLCGKRILIVEDEFLIALMTADILTELGAIPVGPAHTLDAGISLAGSEVIDAALLDVNLHGKQSDAIASVLTGRGVPFVVASGQVAPPWAHRGTPQLDKPFSSESLAQALKRLFP
jgi:DNA-binding response OmpR family regulator